MVKKRMMQVLVVCIMMVVLCTICIKSHIEMERASRTVGGEHDFTYSLKGTVLLKCKNSILLVRVEDIYKEKSPFKENEIFVDCSGIHRWAYEKVTEGQLLSFSFFIDAVNEEVLQVYDIYPADARKAEILYLQDSFTVDYSDLNAVVGDADYVFVGEVLGGSFTDYGDYVVAKNRDGELIEVREPNTNYYVSVIENIKGSLPMQDAICIRKRGGLTKNGMECCLFEGDEYPLEGKQYIFIAYAQEDGSLLLRGSISNIPLEANKEEADAEERNVIAYEDVVKACKGQIDSKVENW